MTEKKTDATQRKETRQGQGDWKGGMTCKLRKQSESKIKRGKKRNSK